MGSERREVLYRGRVQGVGFRFTVREVARRFRVTGFVMNLSDGRVKVVAEGEVGELDRFMAGIGEAMAGYIHDSQSETSPATGEFPGFSIEH